MLSPKDKAMVDFVKATLDDYNGVSGDAIEALYVLIDECESDSELSHELRTIRGAIEATTDNRYYLESEDDG